MILGISRQLVSVSSLTKMFHLEWVIYKLSQIKRLTLAMISNQTSLQHVLKDIPFDGELDKRPLDPGHKPRTGLSFFFNEDVSPGKGKNTSYLK